MVGAPLRQFNVEVFGIVIFRFDTKYPLQLDKLRDKVRSSDRNTKIMAKR